MIRNRARRRPAATLIVLSLIVVGCGGSKALQRADMEVQRGNLDTAIAYYQGILLEDPGNTEATIKLAHVKLDASQQHERQGVEVVVAELALEPRFAGYNVPRVK